MPPSGRIRDMLKTIFQSLFSPAAPLPTLPARARRPVIRLTGGSSPAARLWRQLIWKFRLFVGLILGANIAAAFFEGGTLAFFTVALEVLAGNSENLSEWGFIYPLLQRIEARFSTGGLFISLILAAVVMQLGRSWLDYLGQVASAYLAAWSEGDLRRRLIDQFTTLSYAEISKHKIGNLSSYISEVERVGRLMIFGNRFISHAAIALAYGLVLLWLSWQVTLISLVLLVFLSLGLGRLRTTVKSKSGTFKNAYIALNEKMIEYLSGMRLLHTFNRQSYAQDAVKDIINDSVRARRQVLSLRALVPTIVQSITVIGVAAFLAVSYLIISRTGDYTGVPRLVAFVFAIYRMLPRVTSLNSTLAAINEELPFATRIAEMLEPAEKEYIDEGTRPFAQLQSEIRFESVSFTYRGGSTPSLDNLSLSIPRGRLVALVGESGSGKSSVINLLLRLYNPTVGQLLIDGVPLTEIRRADWLDRVATVDQETFVFNRSIRENLLFGNLQASDAEMIAAAKIANAHQFVEQLSAGYDTVIGNRGYRLSGGQRQRLAIARALIRNPEIIIFDEATSALDSQSERLIQASIEALRQDRTLIVIAHRLSTIARADRIVVLRAGQVVESGTHTELLALQGQYEKLWHLQSET